MPSSNASKTTIYSDYVIKDGIDAFANIHSNNDKKYFQKASYMLVTLHSRTKMK